VVPIKIKTNTIYLLVIIIMILFAGYLKIYNKLKEVEDLIGERMIQCKQ
jgi:hypothetical protein